MPLAEPLSLVPVSCKTHVGWFVFMQKAWWSTRGAEKLSFLYVRQLREGVCSWQSRSETLATRNIFRVPVALVSILVLVAETINRWFCCLGRVWLFLSIVVFSSWFFLSFLCLSFSQFVSYFCHFLDLQSISNSTVWSVLSVNVANLAFVGFVSCMWFVLFFREGDIVFYSCKGCWCRASH